MESTESRFAHLLQPIRELTKNWDVDVASELNDYLEEVRGVLRVLMVPVQLVPVQLVPVQLVGGGHISLFCSLCVVG